MNLLKPLRRLWRVLQLGYARRVYVDLYSAGVLTEAQFLLLMDETDLTLGGKQ